MDLSKELLENASRFNLKYQQMKVRTFEEVRINLIYGRYFYKNEEFKKRYNLIHIRKRRDDEPLWGVSQDTAEAGKMVMIIYGEHTWTCTAMELISMGDEVVALW